MFTKIKMPHNKPAMRLSQRIAEEAQLLAEEKWIIDALKKIKAQRNGLQIERLHLESLKAEIVSKMNKDQPDKSSTMATISSNNTLENMRPSDILDDDEMCNTEELNLSVTNSVFNIGIYNQMGDEEEDEEDIDNCVLDIDLLMSSK